MLFAPISSRSSITRRLQVTPCRRERVERFEQPRCGGRERTRGKRIDLALSVGRYLHSTRTLARAPTHRRRLILAVQLDPPLSVRIFLRFNLPALLYLARLSPRVFLRSAVIVVIALVREDAHAIARCYVAAGGHSRARCHGHGHCRRSATTSTCFPCSLSLSLSISLSSAIEQPYLWLVARSTRDLLRR